MTTPSASYALFGIGTSHDFIFYHNVRNDYVSIRLKCLRLLQRVFAYKYILSYSSISLLSKLSCKVHNS